MTCLECATARPQCCTEWPDVCSAPEWSTGDDDHGREAPEASETMIITGDTKRSGPYKMDQDVTDPGSTGRKRAVQIKPITEGMICEWSWLSRAGGGIHPIIGCDNNKAETVHHGPDKNTLNNNIANLHAICWTCHNRWHGLNDSEYGESKLKEGAVAHDNASRVFSKKVIVANDHYFEVRKSRRGPYYPDFIEEGCRTQQQRS